MKRYFSRLQYLNAVKSENLSWMKYFNGVKYLNMVKYSN